jgi:predicted AlkP superfamily phosphohydrolase/phosphomutase
VTRRSLLIGLDGYEKSVADRLIAEGRLPNLQRLERESAQVALDHGKAKRTGLAWEHVSLGREPAASKRHAAVRFDPATYQPAQFGTIGKPFLAELDVTAVIFDAPYFDLLAAPNCRGLVNWGAHDAGVARQCAPAGLDQEIEEKFGPYPATPYIYGFVWHDAGKARKMAEALVRAVDLRAAIGRWLLCERLPEWDVGLLVISEFHSAIEALWHGYDPGHPLHHLPSAAPARDGIIGVYEAFDRMLGDYRAAMPDVDLVVFSMHGMGANDSDVPTMLLLPELLFRASFGVPLLQRRADWIVTPDSVPMLRPGEQWSRVVRACLTGADGVAIDPEHQSSLDWMPAACYRQYWPRMEAFALPSYYDGRIRVNLAGRERDGLVALAGYEAKLESLCDLLRQCRNPRNGESVIRNIDRPVAADPLHADQTEADLVITWRGCPLALWHERFGLIGPAPYRRTGGHSGGHGIAYLTSDRLARGAAATASSFDIVPTVIDLLGLPVPAGLSGRSLVPSLRSGAPAGKAAASA